jgi:anti-anti-sigma factor
MSAPLAIERTVEPRCLRVAGELDMSNVAELSEELRREMAVEGDVVVDLAAVTFVDSTGLQTLFSVARDLEGRGRLVLIDPQPRVQAVFRYVMLDDRANVEIRSNGRSAPSNGG